MSKDGKEVETAFRNGRFITDPTGKANELNYYYSTIFSGEDSIQHIQEINSANQFTIDIKTFSRRIRAVGKNKSVGPDNIPGEIIKMGEEAMIPYLARLLEMTVNNSTLPGDCRRATVVPVYKGGVRLLVTNYRPVSLTSVVCKQMELYSNFIPTAGVGSKRQVV